MGSQRSACHESKYQYPRSAQRPTLISITRMSKCFLRFFCSVFRIAILIESSASSTGFYRCCSAARRDYWSRQFAIAESVWADTPTAPTDLALTKAELARRLGLLSTHGPLDVPPHRIWAAVLAADVNADDTIDYSEFRAAMLDLCAPFSAEHAHAFKPIEWRQLSTECHELATLITDSNQNGIIEYAEWLPALDQLYWRVSLSPDEKNRLSSPDLEIFDGRKYTTAGLLQWLVLPLKQTRSVLVGDVLIGFCAPIGAKNWWLT